MAPRVFSCAGNARDDGIRVVLVKRKKTQYIFTRGMSVALREHLLVTRRVDKRCPLVTHRVTFAERQVVVYIDEARHIFRAFRCIG